jgi:hypothetical protein
MKLKSNHPQATKRRGPEGDPCSDCPWSTVVHALQRLKNAGPDSPAIQYLELYRVASGEANVLNGKLILKERPERLMGSKVRPGLRNLNKEEWIQEGPRLLKRRQQPFPPGQCLSWA